VSEELQRLWRLAEIDRKLVEIRMRAASFDAGQKLQAELDRLTEEENQAKAKYRGVQQETTDLELTQKADEDKIKKINREMFGGKVVNPREVANLEKEIELIKKKKDHDEERLLELYESVDEPKAAFEAAHKKAEAKRAELAERKKKAVEERKLLEEAYSQLGAKRGDATKGISPTTLGRYDSIRQKHAGIGMARINLKTSMCEACGTHLPEKSIEMAKDDRIASCEACHRILYYSESVV
jgi:uncharacterized protein